jgi:glycerol kinase
MVKIPMNTSSPFILALDQGTSSSRACLIDADGAVRAIASRPLPISYPQPGWVEQDPEAIWQTQIDATCEVLATAGIAAREIAAVGITNQRETTLVWERATGRPIHPAIVWQCRRTADRCALLREGGWEPRLREKTGLVPDPYFSGTKVAHILDTVEDARTAAERGELLFGTVDTFLAWRLTGGRLHVTDVSNASRTLLYNLRTGDWDNEILAELRVPRAMLPAVRASSELYGEIDEEWFGAALPLAGIAGDQQAALFGQACFQPGTAKNTYGTGCFLLTNTGARPVPSHHGLLTTVAWRLAGSSDPGSAGVPPASVSQSQTASVPPASVSERSTHSAPVPETAYALEGAVFVAGAAVQWLRDGLGLITSAAETEALATSVPDTGGVFVVPAFAGLGAPYWDPAARGTIVGLTRGTTRAHLVRATLEAIAHQTCDVVEAMASDRNAPLLTLRVDGGASANDFLMQRQADLLGLPVERAAVAESTALGAAFLAGLAIGLWPSPETLAAHWRADRTFEPHLPPGDRADLRHTWRRAIDRARDWEP